MVCLMLVTLGILIPAALLWAPVSVIDRVQLGPLLASGAIAAGLSWLAITLIFGRIYCSTVCPAGTLQDIFSRLPRLRAANRARNYYRYSPPANPLRYTVLAIAVMAWTAGVAVIVAVLDPFTTYGMIVGRLIGSAVEALGGREIVAGSLTGVLTALAALAILAGASWLWGRVICNTLCPVGSLLSIPARYSLFRFDVDTDLCTGCMACVHSCKAQCISPQTMLVDQSRCVVCFDCSAVCPENAIRYTCRHKRLSLPMLRKIQPATPSACAGPRQS